MRGRGNEVALLRVEVAMTQTPRAQPKSWRVHDIILGLLGGGGISGVIGLIISVRNNDNLAVI